jgi:hypothetical protein
MFFLGSNITCFAFYIHLCPFTESPSYKRLTNVGGKASDKVTSPFSVVCVMDLVEPASRDKDSMYGLHRVFVTARHPPPLPSM